MTARNTTWILVLVTVLGAPIAVAVAVGTGSPYWWLIAAASAAVVALTPPLVAETRASLRERAGVTAARERVREAESSLAEALRPNKQTPSTDSAAAGNGHGETKVAGDRSDDRLALAALWSVTHGRLDLYHRIATDQARRSFFTAQAAMLIGFLLLIGFAVLAVRARTPVAAITAGSLGAVAAAFAGYIGRTFVRSQESAAAHLRAYFDQPLDFSKYLAAERLLAVTEDLTAEQQAQIVASLVRAIVTPGSDHLDNGSPAARRKMRRSREGDG
jgi:hypothetical protein